MKVIRLPLTCNQIIILVCIMPLSVILIGHLLDIHNLFVTGIALLIVEMVVLIMWGIAYVLTNYDIRCKCK